MYQVTTALRKLLKLKKRIRGVQGGTAAGKTVSILQILIHLAQTDKTPTITSVTSETLPHLKRGALRDFRSILETHGYWRDECFSGTDFIYTFETGSKIEFFSLDEPHKVRGPRRDRLFINEANNIPYETFDQLEVRTREVVWLDWNPVSEFWWHSISGGSGVRDREDAEEIILTYKDNEALPVEFIRSIEMRKENKNWWRIYGEGLLGVPEGKIYTDWKIIDSIPHEARLVRYGVDFGYTNDPTAIVAVYEYNGGYILDEICYRSGLKNREIADILLSLPYALTVADSSEPKSIDELKEYGVFVEPSQKGQGSILYGIQKVQDQKISVTKTSLNILKEYRNYFWKEDRDGKILNEPEGGFDHAMDAIRYAIVSMRGSGEDLFRDYKQFAKVSILGDPTWMSD